MRIPLRRVYRAFEELDAFSDEECERFVRGARAQSRIGLWTTLTVIGGAILWLVAARSTHTLILSRNPGTRPEDFEARYLLDLLAMVTGCLGLPIVSALPALLLRDRLLIRAIRNRILLARCPACRYSLLGLTVATDSGVEVVRCPECGETHRLDDLGLTATDLIAR